MSSLEKKKRLVLDLAERMDLPEEALPGTVKLSITGGRQVLVENHKGLLAYDTEQIRVSTGRGSILIRGAELDLAAMDQKELLVTGKLQALEWE